MSWKINEGDPFIVWLEDQDGGEVGCETFETEEDLLKTWPHAVKDGPNQYTAWKGSRA